MPGDLHKPPSPGRPPARRGMSCNPAIGRVPRNTRRKLLLGEKLARKSGDWGGWETIIVPPEFRGRGWLGDVKLAMKNRVFCVLIREIQDGVRHLAVSSLSGIRPDWHEMQRIKNEVCSKQHTGVEVYPPDDEVVDGADMFHVWVLPGSLPFSLCEAGSA